MNPLLPSKLMRTLAHQPVKYFFAVFFVLLGSMFVVGVKTTSAFSVNSLPTIIQDEIGDFDGATGYPPTGYSENECASYDPGYFPWISSPSDTSSTTIAVPSGTTSVPLQLNNLVYVCHQAVSSGAVFPANGTPVSPYNGGANTLPTNQIFKIASPPTATVVAGPGSEGGVVGYSGNQFSIPGYGSQADRFWEGPQSTSPLTFQTSTGAGLTQTESVQITLSEVAVSYYQTGSGTLALCVVGDTVAASQTDPLSTCPSEPITVTITLNVPGTGGGGTGNINGFKVNTSDNDTGPYSGANISECTTGANSTANPFGFNSVPAGDNCVSAGTVAGYTVEGSTWCDSTTACDPGYGPGGNHYTAGASTTVVVTNGSTVQMRWIYTAGSTLTGDPCPPFAATQSNISSVPVTLATTLPANSGAPPGQYGAGSGVEQTYTANAPATTVTGVVDSNPGTDPSGLTASVNGSYTANPVNLDYTNYYQNYAYDNDTPVVNYTFSYTETVQPYSYTGAFVAGQGNTLVYGTPVTIQFQQPMTQTGPTMPECFARTYSLAPQNGSTIWTNGNPEDPNGVSYNSVVNFAFDESNAHKTALRVASRVAPVTTATQFVLYHEGNNGQLTPAAGSSYTANCGSTSPNPVPYAEPSTLSGTAPNPSIPGSYSGSVNVSQTCSAGIPPLQYGDSVCTVLSTNSSAGQMDQNGSISSITTGMLAQSGALPTTAAQISGGTYSYCTPFTYAEPYVKVFGGDAVAGASSSDPDLCISNAGGDITAWNQNATPYAGSGTALASLAPGAINGFASGQALLSALATAKYLAFANTANTPAGNTTYGGGYATTADSSCITATNDPNSYYGQAATLSGTGASSLSALLTTLATKAPGYYVYKMSSSETTIPAITLYTGQHVVLYTSGTITITGNSSFNLSGVTNASQLPGFELVTQGTINVPSSVTQLAGNFIAEGGTINDCSDVTDLSQLFANCSNQLVVDGSFVANTVDLYRTHGSLHQATANETAGGGSPNSAEQFDYSPLNWLVPVYTNKQPSVQSITSLPPVL
jgi:hypothetical protein